MEDEKTSEKKYEIPPLNWFGAMMVSRHLLSWSKGGIDDEESAESFFSKMNRVNWIQRVNLLLTVINAAGPTPESAKFIQEVGFFTDVSTEALAKEMEKAIDVLNKGSLFKFSSKEFGSLDFSKSNLELPKVQKEGEEE
jgi:hypothetical protein